MDSEPGYAIRTVEPPGWKRPSGYSNGIVAEGPTVYVSGQVGWDAEGRFADGMAAQVEQALRNIVTVVEAAGGEAADIVRLTWFVTSVEAYERDLKDIGAGYRQVIGRHFPTMTVVEVSRLVERDALVEIEATAVLPRSR